MQGEDLEAGNNLRSFSQRTSYISDWATPAKPKPNRYQEPIPEEQPETHLPPISRRQAQIQKETSEKYDLRKYEKKLHAIQKQESTFTAQRADGKAQKVRQQIERQDAKIVNRRQSKSMPWIRPVEAEYLRRHVQLFQRKNSDSHRELQVRMVIHRQKPAALSLNAKLTHQLEKRGRVVVTDQDIADIKSMIAKGSQRISLVHLIPDDCLPAIRSLH